MMIIYSNAFFLQRQHNVGVKTHIYIYIYLETKGFDANKSSPWSKGTDCT